jgi:hypothetical protein
MTDTAVYATEKHGSRENDKEWFDRLHEGC